jgi:hypothetical protein
MIETQTAIRARSTAPERCHVCGRTADFTLPRRHHAPVSSCAAHYPLVWRRFLGPRRWRAGYATECGR